MTKKLLTTFAKSRRSHGSKVLKRGVGIIAPLLCIGGGLFWFHQIFDPQNEHKQVVLSDKPIEETVTPPPEKKEILIPRPAKKDFPDIPFYTQAPLGQWQDPLFQNACEEASMLMVSDALQAKKRTPEEATKELRRVAEWQTSQFGTSVDTNTKAVAETLRKYFSVEWIEEVESLDTEKIKELLVQQGVLLVPLNGQRLANTHFTLPGPRTHMIVIFDYNPEKNTFITHDPGTKFGGSYEYKAEILFQALGDYPTGNHLSYQEPLLKSGIAVWNHSDPLQN